MAPDPKTEALKPCPNHSRYTEGCTACFVETGTSAPAIERDAPTGIEALVCEDIAKRQLVGIAKYGTTLAGNPADRTERIRHAYEEALDLAVYLRWELERSESADQERLNG